MELIVLAVPTLHELDVAVLLVFQPTIVQPLLVIVGDVTLQLVLPLNRSQLWVALPISVAPFSLNVAVNVFFVIA